MQKLTGFAAADGTAWQRRRLCRPAPAELLKKQARFPGKQQPDINVFPQNCFRTVKQFSQAEKSGFPVGMLPQGKRQKEDTAERDSQAAANQGCLCHRCCRRSWLPCGDSRCGRDWRLWRGEVSRSHQRTQALCRMRRCRSFASGQCNCSDRGGGLIADGGKAAACDACKVLLQERG